MKTLSLKNVSVRFGSVKALKDVSVDIEAGQVLMLVGPNGAGKSTLSKVLLGLVRPQSGLLRVDGAARAVNNSLKREFGYLPEAVAFSENLSARQVLRFFCWARGVPRKRIDEVLERVGLRAAARRKVRGYSRGMRQRLGLAVAILADPNILVLDEPASGLDSEGLSVLWSILQEWRERGRMVLMASHQLALLERRVDRMAVFKSGRVIADGSPLGLRESAEMCDRVHIVGSDDEDSVQQLVAALNDWPGGRLDLRENGAPLVVELEAGQLIGMMEIAAQHKGAVQSIRVEEPTLDVVYEKLLEAA